MNDVSFAPPFPTNPQPGDTFCGWTWNGSMWVCTQSQGVIIQTFATSGPYTPSSPNLIGISVETVGGGAAGGGAIVTNLQYALGGGGGGAGAYARKALSPALVRGGVLVTVGLGGVGGPGIAGGNGGVTSFGALCVATGGQGGNYNNAPAGWGAPGLGGSIAGCIGDVISAGAPGTPGFTDLNGLGTEQVIFGGSGGDGPWGGGGQALYAGGGTIQAGHSGVGPGAGGSGGIANTVAGDAAGGLGAAGMCVVTEYIFFDQGGSWSGGGCGPGGARVQSWRQLGGPEGFDD